MIKVESFLVSEERLAVTRNFDVVLVCQKARDLASSVGLEGNDQVCVVIATSEVTRNILLYAGEGEVWLRHVRRENCEGLSVVASDRGPGIPDVELALQDGYSTGGGLGVGLSGARRLMDDFHVESEVGEGTVITMTKWAVCS